MHTQGQYSYSSVIWGQYEYRKENIEMNGVNNL